MIISKRSSRDNWPSMSTSSNPRLTSFVSGKASHRRWRHRRYTYRVDPWSRRQEDTRGVLRFTLNTEKKDRHRRRIDQCFRLFSTNHRPIVFSSDAWPAPATYRRLSYEACDPRVSRSPQRARPVQISWCSVVRLVDRYLARTRNLAAFTGFISGRSCPNIPPKCFFSSSLPSKLNIWPLRERYRSTAAWRVSLEHFF